MALSLSSERPNAAALSGTPFAWLGLWLAAVRAKHAQRVAARALLEFDEHRLDDLGISRQDLFEAIEHPKASGARLSASRARRARAWYRSI